MFENLLSQLGPFKEKMEEVHKKLDSITVTGEAGEGGVQVVCSGNREVRDVSISQEIHQEAKEDLEDLIVVATNKALKEAEQVYSSEMEEKAREILPNMPGS